MKLTHLFETRARQPGLQRLNVLRPVVAPGRRGLVVLGIFWSPSARFAYKVSHFVRTGDGAARALHGEGFTSSQAAMSAGVAAFVRALREAIRGELGFPEARWLIPDPSFLDYRPGEPRGPSHRRD